MDLGKEALMSNKIGGYNNKSHSITKLQNKIKVFKRLQKSMKNKGVDPSSTAPPSINKFGDSSPYLN